jgi:ABC-type polysaccharide/polyol phosphate export permease
LKPAALAYRPTDDNGSLDDKGFSEGGRMIKALRELGRYKELVYYLVATNLKVRYRNSWMGFLWTLLNPLLFMLVLWAVFSKMGGSHERSFSMFLLSGLIIWNFFQQAVEAGLDSILGQRSLLQKIYVPKLVFPLSIVTANLVNLVFFLISYLVIAPFTKAGIPPTIIWVLPSIVMCYVLTLGLALIAATANVFYRDFYHLLPAILRILFYMTPIVYSADFLGEGAANWLRFNPVYYPVITARAVMYYGTIPSLQTWMAGFAVAFGTLAVGFALFLRCENKFLYYV